MMNTSVRKTQERYAKNTSKPNKQSNQNASTGACAAKCEVLSSHFFLIHFKWEERFKFLTFLDVLSNMNGAMINTFLDVKEKGFSIRQAALQHVVSWATLQRRFSVPPNKIGKPTMLTDFEEGVLATLAQGHESFGSVVMWRCSWSSDILEGDDRIYFYIEMKFILFSWW